MTDTPADEPTPDEPTPTGDADETAPSQDQAIVAEARWPMAGAVLAAMVLTILLPEEIRWIPPWLLPTIEGVLLLTLIVGDPGAIDRRSNALRGLSIALVAVLVAGALCVDRGR